MTTDSKAERIALSVSVELADGQPPSSFRIFRAGENFTTKGVFLFDDGAAAAVMASHAERGIELPIDYDHAMADGSTSPLDRIAAGWFTPAVVDGELHATSITWTPRAAQQLADREWRYMSPWFLADKAEGTASRRPRRLLNVALTNTPSTNNLDPIVAHDDHEQGVTKMAEKTPDPGMDAGELIALTGATGLDDARSVILAWRERAALVDAAEARATEAEAKLSAIESERTAEKAAALISDAIKAGKLPPARRESAERIFADHGIAVLESTLSILSPIVPSAKPSAPIGDADVQLTDDDRKVMARFGISEQAMLKARRDEAQKAG